jgi:hypothetical protein
MSEQFCLHLTQKRSGNSSSDSDGEMSEADPLYQGLQTFRHVGHII